MDARMIIATLERPVNTYQAQDLQLLWLIAACNDCFPGNGAPVRDLLGRLPDPVGQIKAFDRQHTALVVVWDKLVAKNLTISRILRSLQEQLYALDDMVGQTTSTLATENTSADKARSNLDWLDYMGTCFFQKTVPQKPRYC